MSQSLLDRFEISADDLRLLQQCGEMFGATTFNRVVDRFYEWLPKQPEFVVFFKSRDEVDRVKALQKIYWTDFFSGVVDQRYVEYRIHIGNLHAQRDLPSEDYFAGMLQFQLLFHGRTAGEPWRRPTAASNFRVHEALSYREAQQNLG